MGFTEKELVEFLDGLVGGTGLRRRGMRRRLNTRLILSRNRFNDSGQLFSEYARCSACVFAELPAEMFYIPVPALFCDFCDALLRVGEKVFCLAEPEINNVIHTGISKLSFVKQLQMTRANVQLLCHFVDGPRQLWIVGNLSAQREQFMTVGGGIVVQDFVVQP